MVIMLEFSQNITFISAESFCRIYSHTNFLATNLYGKVTAPKFRSTTMFVLTEGQATIIGNLELSHC